MQYVPGRKKKKKNTACARSIDASLSYLHEEGVPVVHRVPQLEGEDGVRLQLLEALPQLGRGQPALSLIIK